MSSKCLLCNLRLKFIDNLRFIVHNDNLNFSLFQIEREKCDLSIQVISLSERLEEAEGGAESQVMSTFHASPLMFVHSRIFHAFIFSLKSTASAMLSWQRCASSLKTSTWSPRKLPICWRRSIKKLLLTSTNKLKLSQKLKIGKCYCKILNLSLSLSLCLFDMRFRSVLFF